MSAEQFSETATRVPEEPGPKEYFAVTPLTTCPHVDQLSVKNDRNCTKIHISGGPNQNFGRGVQCDGEVHEVRECGRELGLSEMHGGL